MCLTNLKNRRAVTLAVLLLLFSSSFGTVAVHGQEAEAAGFNLQSYAPARILVTYSYTNNFSVTDVSSIGKSLYKITSGPTSIEFHATDIDQYTFTVEIKYAAIVTQSIQIAVFSGGYAPEGIQLNVKGNVVRLKFTLTVTEEPRYPSAQDVAEQVVLQVSHQLADFRRQTETIVNIQNHNIEIQWILVAFNLVVNVILLVAVFFWMRTRRED